MSENLKVTPKDFFLWLGAMAALYWSIGSFITLMFTYIEYLVGSTAVTGYGAYSGAMQFAIASLIVVFPVYIALTRMLNKDLRNNPTKKELWVRRWAIVLAVFLAGAAILIDLIVLITTFLSGDELTAAFILKVLTVLAIAGGVFYYYLSDIKGKWESNEKLSKMIGAGVSVVVLIAVVSAFFVMGSPHTQRLYRYDNQRINDLQNIQSQLTEYYRTAESLPETLEDLDDPLVHGYIDVDPETGEAYEYTKTGRLSFELCATFSLPLPEIDNAALDPNDWRARDLQRTAADWPHDEGRTCFEREVDPDRIVPIKY